MTDIGHVLYQHPSLAFDCPRKSAEHCRSYHDADLGLCSFWHSGKWTSASVARKKKSGIDIGVRCAWDFRCKFYFSAARHANVFTSLEFGRRVFWSINGREQHRQWDSRVWVSTGEGLRLSSGPVIHESSGNDSGEIKQTETLRAAKGIFPGGTRRAEVRLPGLIMRVLAKEVLEEECSGKFLSQLSSAVVEGLTMVVLEPGKEGSGGAILYTAACILKATLKGRAELLVAERVDIAAAAGADGVLLSDEGLPTVVARRMMQNSTSEGVVLPIVARSVTSLKAAKNATAMEGADLLLLQCSKDADPDVLVWDICQEVSIPVFVECCGSQYFPEGNSIQQLQEILLAGASGLALSRQDILAGDNVSSYVARLSSSLNHFIQQRSSRASHSGQVGTEVISASQLDGSQPIYQSSDGLGDLVEVAEALDLEGEAKLIVEEERLLLASMVDFVAEAAPEMEEVSLLVDSLKQLDDLFLLVIVGEFNSGKSSIINALLGNRFLKEGVLPTTNEITLLCHSGDASQGGERSERHPDGHFLRFLPADLLKQMNLVDTPGTNVILQRQQRLTEEFVPRADLVLFVLSVDRPLTESEVTFLRYIRQWGKKIIFILNKCDVLSELAEVEEVTRFVQENAERLLSVENVRVYPVSARRALLAKRAATNEYGVLNKDILSQDSFWKSSGFQDVEDFIWDFFDGASDAGAERLRLKLETPLGIGMALLLACDRQLLADIEHAELDLKVLLQIDELLQEYQKTIQANAALQQQYMIAVVGASKGRGLKFVESQLRLSNVGAMANYLLGAHASKLACEGFDSEVIGSAVMDCRKVLNEYDAWLQSSSVQQLNRCMELLRTRWPNVNSGFRSGTLVTNQQQQFSSMGSSSMVEGKSSMEVLDGFDTKAAAILLEQEIREVVLSTIGGFGAAGLSASVLTSVLPTTLEDLAALGICSAGGFLGVWNLPGRRQEVKGKVEKMADSLARQIQEAMETELQLSLEKLRVSVDAVTGPYRTAIKAEKTRVVALQSRLQEIDKFLSVLRQKVGNLGT